MCTLRAREFINSVFASIVYVRGGGGGGDTRAVQAATELKGRATQKRILFRWK